MMDFANSQMSFFENTDFNDVDKQDVKPEDVLSEEEDIVSEKIVKEEITKEEITKEENVEKLDISFEDALKELDQIVQELQRSDLALDKSMELFRRGTQLIQFSKEILDEAEQEVTELLKSGEEVAFD